MSITINGSTGISGVDGSVSTPAIRGADSDTGISFGTNEVKINTNGTAAINIDSTQQTGFGTSSVSFSQFGSNTGGIAVADLGATNTGIKLSDGNYHNYLVQAGNSNLYLSHYGDGGDIIFGTGSSGNERARILYNGGLTFNGDTAAVNALDDYEEGTWSPTITGGTTPGTVTYSYQAGSYVKVGGKVTLTWYVQWSSGTGSGTFTIGGLPFATANDLSRITTGSVMMDSVSYSADYVVPYSQYGTTEMLLYGTTAGNSWAAIPYDANGAIIGHLTYRTN